MPSTWALTVRSGGVACVADATIASAWALIFWYCPSPTRESTSRSRLSSSRTFQSCTIVHTRIALAFSSSSVGGAVSISFCLASHHVFAAARLASLLGSVPSCRQETAYILPRYFLEPAPRGRLPCHVELASHAFRLVR